MDNMKNKEIPSVALGIDKCSFENAVDSDAALAVAGLGSYNIKYCLALSLFLIAAIVEPVGHSFVLPAAICDLGMSNSMRGFISSVPYMGIVLTSYPWGYLVDTRGRKLVVIYASLAAGSLSVLSAFMPELISFTTCKLLTSLCIACPAAVPFTFIGEILPLRYRDITMSMINALQLAGSIFVPMLAWAILPLDFRINFGTYYFRSWRLLVIANSSLFFISSFLLSFGPESPKYLISQRKHDEALNVLQKIYAGNNKKSLEEYPIKYLIMGTNERQQISFLKSLKVQTAPLFKPPLLKWLVLNGFILFGMYSGLNGLYMWVPDIINRVLTGSGAGLTACEVIGQRLNETAVDEECIDTIQDITYIISIVGYFACTVIALVISSLTKIISKKTLLLGDLVLIGIFCIFINFITEHMVFAALLSILPLLAVSIGPVNAYSVEIFPTQLRGMAVSLTMMMGRAGSVFGTNVAGAMLSNTCEITFYFFGGLLIRVSESTVRWIVNHGIEHWRENHHSLAIILFNISLIIIIYYK